MDVTKGLGRIEFAEADGSLPEVAAAGRAPGESGVSILHARFKQGVHFSGELCQNLILFPNSQITFDCRLADRRLRHAPRQGSLAVCPTGIDCSADGKGSTDIAMIVVDQAQLSFAAASTFGDYVSLKEHFHADDPALFKVARQLWQECAACYPNGSLFWSELSFVFMEKLLKGYSAGISERPAGTLDQFVLGRVRQYIVAHLSEPLDIPSLAGVAGCSPFHFARVFVRSTGMSPHRYVIQHRLGRALELIRDKHLPLADIAASTGFSDQSHMSRWMKRVYGVSPSQAK